MVEIPKEEDVVQHEKDEELDTKKEVKATLDVDDDDEDDDDDFDNDEDDDDEDDDDDDDDDEESEEEAEDLDAPGPSQGRAKKQKRDDDDDAKILAGLSGDEVDPGNIIQGGRGARRGRYAGGASGSGGVKYSAKVEMASDEDSW